MGASILPELIVLQPGPSISHDNIEHIQYYSDTYIVNYCYHDGLCLSGMEVWCAVTSGEGRIIERDDKLVFGRGHLAGEYGIFYDSLYNTSLPLPQEHEAGVYEWQGMPLPQPLVHCIHHVPAFR